MSAPFEPGNSYTYTKYIIHETGSFFKGERALFIKKSHFEKMPLKSAATGAAQLFSQSSNAEAASFLLRLILVLHRVKHFKGWSD